MASSLNYDGALTCALQVTDLETSLRWYEDTLGFQLLYKAEEIGWCELKTEIPKVLVGLSQVERVEGKGGAVLTFGVRDVDEARRQLDAKDVQFDGPTQTIPDMVKLATFFDPDGNAFMLAQDLQQE